MFRRFLWSGNTSIDFQLPSFWIQEPHAHEEVRANMLFGEKDASIIQFCVLFLCPWMLNWIWEIVEIKLWLVDGVTQDFLEKFFVAESSSLRTFQEMRNGMLFSPSWTPWTVGIQNATFEETWDSMLSIQDCAEYTTR